MHEEVISAVIDISLGYFTDDLHNKPPQTQAILSSLIRNYITGTIDFQNLENNFHQYIENTKPLQEIKEIMEIGKEPIPETAESPNSDDSSGNHKRKKSHPWTHYEDQRLIAGIMKYGIENWTSISRFVGNGRTRSQCSQRWMRGLDPKISKSQWSKQEEDFLLQLIHFHGNKAWTAISSQMRNRSDVQCRYKYKQLLKEKRIQPGAIPGMNPLIHANLSTKGRKSQQPIHPSPQELHYPQPQQMQPIYIPQMMMPMQQGMMIPGIQQYSSPNMITTPITPPMGAPIPQPSQLSPIPSIQTTLPIPEPPAPVQQAQPIQQSHQVQFTEETVQSHQPPPAVTHTTTHLSVIQDSPREPKLPHVAEFTNSPMQHSPITEFFLHKNTEKEPVADIDVFHHAAPSIDAPVFNAKLYSVY